MTNSKTPTYTEWMTARRENLISTITAVKEVLPGSFGTDDELREIGLLTLRFADLEEGLSFHCEMLLMRPELRGFHRPKLVLLMPFTEKLNLLKELTIAVGVLRSIDTDALEEAIESARKTGERRNNIIHGYLYTKDDGNVVFRNKGSELAAELGVLRSLNSQVLQVDEAVTKAFMNFYGELMERAPGELPEKPMLNAISSRLPLLQSTAKADVSRHELAIAHKEAAIAQKTLRSSAARLRESKKRLRKAEVRLPAEYQTLARERDALSERCAMIRKRSRNGITDSELELETAKLRDIEVELQRLRERYKSESKSAVPGAL